MADVSEFLAQQQDFIGNHLRIYLESDGKEGHVLDLSDQGALPNTTTLLLKTIGRKSGRESVVPLIYDKIGEEFVIVASKGGSDQHPAWYVNLLEQPEVRFQVATDKYLGTWRLIEGSERPAAWEQLADFYPPYRDYEKRTDRVIPMVAMKVTKKIDAL